MDFVTSDVIESEMIPTMNENGRLVDIIFGAVKLKLRQNAFSFLTETFSIQIPRIIFCNISKNSFAFQFSFNKYVSTIISHITSRKTNGVQFSSGPRNQCPRFWFLHREKPKTWTSRTLSSSSKKVLISTFP